MFWKKKADLQKLPLHYLENLMSLILTNQCLTIIVGSGTVINIVPLNDIAHVRIQREIGGPDPPPPPLEITSTYMGF